MILSCQRDVKSDLINETYTYNYIVKISDKHITEISWTVNDTIKSVIKYLFTDSLITVINYYPANTEQGRTIYKIGSNGFAESSYTIPEHYFLYYSDTIYDSRLHYHYDSENHMVQADLEVHTPNSMFLDGYFTNSYDSGNLVKHTDLEQPFRVCEVSTYYEPSEVIGKLDLLNFTNGILGITSDNLIRSKTLTIPSSVECGNFGSTVSNFTYTLDNQGFVVQSKEVSTNHSVKHNYTSITSTIRNYEIQIIN